MKLPEAWVSIYAPHVVRGELLAQIFPIAAELGYEPWVVKSQSDGFLIPSDVFAYLYPSQAPETETLNVVDPVIPELPVPDLVTVELPEFPAPVVPAEPVTDAEIRAWAAANDVEVASRGALSQSVRDQYAAAQLL